METLVHDINCGCVGAVTRDVEHANLNAGEADDTKRYWGAV